MYMVGSVIALLAIVALLYGLFLGIFRKGKRKRGWIIAALAFFVGLPGALALVALDPNAPPPSQRKQVAVVDSPSSGSTPAPRESQPVAVQVSEADATAEPFHPVLSEPAALNAYCDGLRLSDGVYREADEKFGVGSSEERFQWERQRQEEISQQTTDNIGVPHDEWFSYAIEHFWDHRCEAIARGWRQVELADIQAATGRDTARVKDAILLNYMHRLDADEGDVFFDKETFNHVSCQTKGFAGFELIGCRMLGGLLGARSSNTVFYLAANMGGDPVIVPADSRAEEHMKWRSLPDADNIEIPVGEYLGPYPLPGVDWAEVKAHFDK